MAAELRYGSVKKGSPALQRRVDALLTTIPILPLEVPIGRDDLLIAAHALALAATLVTANLGEFNRVRGLTVENWLA